MLTICFANIHINNIYKTLYKHKDWYSNKPKNEWLTELEVAQNILDTRNPNERLIAIIDALNISDTKSKSYLEFAGKCLYYLEGGDDGKLGWEDCKAVVEEYYEGYVKVEK